MRTQKVAAVHPCTLQQNIHRDVRANEAPNNVICICPQSAWFCACRHRLRRIGKFRLLFELRGTDRRKKSLGQTNRCSGWRRRWSCHDNALSTLRRHPQPAGDVDDDLYIEWAKGCISVIRLSEPQATKKLSRFQYVGQLKRKSGSRRFLGGVQCAVRRHSGKWLCSRRRSCSCILPKLYFQLHRNTIAICPHEMRLCCAGVLLFFVVVKNYIAHKNLHAARYICCLLIHPPRCWHSFWVRVRTAFWVCICEHDGAQKNTTSTKPGRNWVLLVSTGKRIAWAEDSTTPSL